MQAGVVVGEGAEVVVARCVQLRGVERGAGTENAGELTTDEFTGLGGLGLVADGDFLAGGEELGDVIVERDGRESGHRVVLALGECEAEDLGGDYGVLEEELKEVAEAEEQQRVFGQPALHLKVLLHHRGELGDVGHGARIGNHERGEIHEKMSRTLPAGTIPVFGFGCGATLSS